ncbi:MAG: hypothetical protein GY814_07970 [Gammaproteobacteria bacterium]|nr:hypothetical protein [Gammaproteobacteria bacterium]
MADTLSPAAVAMRRQLRERYLASARLEGIEPPDQVLAMFDLMDEEGWDTDQCIRFIKELYTDGGSLQS